MDAQGRYPTQPLLDALEGKRSQRSTYSYTVGILILHITCLLRRARSSAPAPGPPMHEMDSAQRRIKEDASRRPRRNSLHTL